ncbi:TauD/TfdA family dioxygenase [Halomonas sp. AOP27-A1-41]|uniref:TauD/TfdA family dioxygenase n=1 Tax=Halomonas sp. AOP27-A1-41 TaxID=3457707 RepID=UPI0040334F0B
MSPSQAWLAGDIERSSQWQRTLSTEERQGLLKGLAAYEQAGMPLWQSTGKEFPFHGIASLIEEIRHEIHQGFGFILLRDFPIEGLTTSQIEALYWGFCNHLGVMRPQGKDSGLLKSVRNAGGQYRSLSGRGYNTNAKLDYHTDFADLVTLLCINGAKTGGESLITSSLALREEMLKSAADLVEALYQPVDYSRQGEHAEHQTPFYAAPIFSQAEGHFCCRYTRNHIRHADRHEGANAPTEQQQRAMDVLDSLAADERFSYEMTLQAGDLQILNNHTVLHSRREFEDFEEPERRRHLLRAWISTPDSQPLDSALAQAYFDNRPGMVRGGILGQEFDSIKQNYTARALAFHKMR